MLRPVSAHSTPSANAVRRAAVTAGIRAITPLALMSFPFGLVYGATAVDNGIDDVPAILASFIIVAGAAQIALVELIDDGASWVIAVGTALVINLRFALYSATLAPDFRAFPARWRFPLAFLLTDQAAVTSILGYTGRPDPFERRWFTLGAALWFVWPWWAGTATGVVLGGEIPDGWQIGFAVPLMFTALLVPTITSRPKLAAAIAGAAVALATAPLPEGMNIMLGAVAGIAVGTVLAERQAVSS